QRGRPARRRRRLPALRRDARPDRDDATADRLPPGPRARRRIPRCAGSARAVAPSVAAIHRTLARLYVDRELQFAIEVPADHVFRGEQQDLEEMLGNLMDNACKWARGRIAATSRRDGGCLTIAIEDDGPGLPEEQQAYAPAPGARFDEKVPGNGLGLAIVRDLA